MSTILEKPAFVEQTAWDLIPDNLKLIIVNGEKDKLKAQVTEKLLMGQKLTGPTGGENIVLGSNPLNSVEEIEAFCKLAKDIVMLGGSVRMYTGVSASNSFTQSKLPAIVNYKAIIS